MENCLSKSKDINVVYSINEPSGGGAAEALQDAGIKDAIIVSVDGGCNPGLKLVEEGTIGATSQQYPVKMAELGVEAIKKIARRRREAGEQPRAGLLRHGCRPGDRQAGRGRAQHHRRRGQEDLLGLTRTYQ